MILLKRPHQLLTGFWKQVEVVPENVPAACTDENVNILSIKEELHSENSIGCDSSLQWFHLRCIYPFRSQKSVILHTFQPSVTRTPSAPGRPPAANL